MEIKVQDTKTFWYDLLHTQCMSIEMLAYHLGLSPYFLKNYFSGEYFPDRYTADRISNFLGVDPDYGWLMFSQSKKRRFTGHLGLKSKQDSDKTSDPKPRRKRRNIRAKDLNFWQELRLSQGLSIDEVANKLGLRRDLVGFIFSGMYMPNNEMILQFCRFFNVDYDKGKSEFEYMHKMWELAHPKEEVKSFDISGILKQIYGKVDYAAYCKIRNISTESAKDILPEVYGGIDYQAYKQLHNLV